MSRPYSDLPLTYTKQIERLKQRGMVFGDEHKAEHYLRHLNYSRLSAYWNIFLDTSSNPPRFREGTTFERILELYRFDRELRLLVLDAIERIEISLRSVWAYEVAHAHGPYAYQDPAYAKCKKKWKQNLQRLEGEMNRAYREPYIQSFLNNHTNTMPPTWIICEVMSLGSLSNWYANLKNDHVRMAIAKRYSIGHSTLESWMHHLTVVRNICAHHGVYWNRKITIKPRSSGSLPRSIRESLVSDSQADNTSRRPYNTFVIILWLMDRIADKHHWRHRLNDLLNKYKPSKKQMGFPKDWRNHPIWKEKTPATHR